jgi:hypothetical protein
MGDGVLIADGRTDEYVIGFGAGSNDNGQRQSNHDVVEHCGASGDQESRRRNSCQQGIRRSHIRRQAIRRQAIRRNPIRRNPTRRNPTRGNPTRRNPTRGNPTRGNPTRRRGT